MYSIFNRALIDSPGITNKCSTAVQGLVSHGRFLCFIVKFLVKADTMNREPVLRFYDPLSITLKKMRLVY